MDIYIGLADSRMQLLDGFCMLGKPLSECFNRREVKLPMISVPCPCTRDDFECNVGFQVALDSRNCVKSSMPLVGSVGPAEETEAAECGLAWEETER